MLRAHRLALDCFAINSDGDWDEHWLTARAIHKMLFHTETVIMAGLIGGALKIDDDLIGEISSSCTRPGDQVSELASLTAELRAELGRPGPLMDVLALGEGAVVCQLLVALTPLHAVLEPWSLSLE